MQRLAEALNVSFQYISLLEGGHRHPSIRFARQCAQYFGDDRNYVEFLAQPIPVEQKRALAESPSAPDFLPQEMRLSVQTEDTEGELFRALFETGGPPPPDVDTPYHLTVEPSTEPVDEESVRLPRELVDRIRSQPAHFSLKARAWAAFYHAYIVRHIEGRKAALPLFQEAEAFLQQEPAEAYPVRLRYLLAVHQALAFRDAGSRDEARQWLDRAVKYANDMRDPDGVMCAQWCQAMLHRDEGDLIGMVARLEEAVKTPGAEPYGVGRCLSEAIHGYLILREHEKVLESVDRVMPIWRTSTLEVPQRAKSRVTFETEIAALEASLRLGKDDVAAVWLNRARAFQARVETSTVQDARLLLAAATLIRRRRKTPLPQRRIEEALSMSLPDDDAGNDVRHRGRLMLHQIALDERRLAAAERLVEEMSSAPSMSSAVHELWRRVTIGFSQCALASAREDVPAGVLALAEVEAELGAAAKADPRLSETALMRWAYDECAAWRNQLDDRAG